MEVKQTEIKSEMEKRLRDLWEQTQEKYQRNAKMMQEDYKKKYE